MRVVLISTNAGLKMGGEAIKAAQYFEYLFAQGIDVHLVTHARNRSELSGHPSKANIHFVEDDLVQAVAWNARIFRFTLNAMFHVKARRILKTLVPENDDVVFHYLCPISPLEPRFPLRGRNVVYGPLNGNLSPPKGFGARVSPSKRVSLMLHRPLQIAMRVLFQEKSRVGWLLNSGGERTRVSLLSGGARENRIIDVFDAGLEFGERSKSAKLRKPKEFLCVARLVRYKGVDLAIRALADLPDDYGLRVLGDGPELESLRQLADSHGLRDRVDFAGYASRGDVEDALLSCRALVFPSFAEANGIVVQEAMWCGTPVIALDHGGPQLLLKGMGAILIKPVSEGQIVQDIAAQMRTLAESDEYAAELSARLRTKARSSFGWQSVAATWMGVYARRIG